MAQTLEGTALDVTRIVLYVSRHGILVRGINQCSTSTWALFLFVFTIINTMKKTNDAV